MDLLFFFIEFVLAVFALLAFGLLVALLAFTWSWAQQQTQKIRVTDVLSVAANEWAAFLACLAAQSIPLKNFHEAPPLERIDAAPQQLPIIFIPSLHTRSSIFWPCFLRLKSLFFTSLWFFDWHFYLKDPLLMEDELNHFINEVLKKTQAQRFRVISFGSSRPIVAKVLESKQRASYCDHWVSISSPDELGSFQKMLLSTRMQEVYKDFLNTNQKLSDLNFYGKNDLFFTEEALSRSAHLSISLETGHFGCLFQLELIDKVCHRLIEESAGEGALLT